MSRKVDKRVEDLIKTIDGMKEEQKQLRSAPVYKTNLIFSGYNFHLCNSVNEAVEQLSSLLIIKSHIETACDTLGVDFDDYEYEVDFDDFIEDVKIRVEKIKWLERNKTIAKLEKLLENLVSEEQKREQGVGAIEELMKNL